MGMYDRNRGRRDLCALPHEDDGRNPKFDATPDHENGRSDTSHRDESLAKQVGRAIESELASLSQAIDWGLHLDHARPEGGSACIRIGVVWTDASLSGDEGRRTVQLWLNTRVPRLRTAVARAISRKRVPVLRITALGISNPHPNLNPCQFRPRPTEQPSAGDTRGGCGGPEDAGHQGELS